MHLGASRKTYSGHWSEKSKHIVTLCVYTIHQVIFLLFNYTFFYIQHWVRSKCHQTICCTKIEQPPLVGQHHRVQQALGWPFAPQMQWTLFGFQSARCVALTGTRNNQGGLRPGFQRGCPGIHWTWSSTDCVQQDQNGPNVKKKSINKITLSILENFNRKVPTWRLRTNMCMWIFVQRNCTPIL